jgi:hypothetical protein
VRWIAGLAGLYLAVALSTRLAERLGMHRCGCAQDCWCQRSGRSTFRWVFPYGHHALDPTQKQRLAEA